MRVLITGAGGFIGQHVVRRLLQLGFDVVTLDRRQTATRAGSKSIEVDLLSTHELPEIVADAQADILIHLAWYTEHGAFWHSPLNHDWVIATARLFDAFCQAGGHRIVGIGTFAEYGWIDQICRESSTPLRPATAYGVAKNNVRREMVALCNTRSISHAWVRVFIPIGTGESRRRLIPSIIDALKGRRELFAIDGEASRDFMHVSDVASGIVTVAMSETVGALNVCSGRPTRISDIVSHLAYRLDTDGSRLSKLFTRRPSDPLIIYGDNELIRSLGWSPTLSTEDALDRILAAETAQ